VLAAVAFLTPFGRARVPTARTLDVLPVVGALIGLAVGGVWWAADRLWAAPVAAALTVATDAAFTGCLHLDGLADSADGLLPPLDRERRLTVMRDPAVGAFGAVTLLVVLLLRVTALASVHPAPLVIGALWCASRTAMALIARTMRYARDTGGLVSAFGTDGPGARRVVPLLAGAALAVPLALLGQGWHGLIALAVAAAGAALVAALARARLGGCTGDVLGAAGVLAETAGLIALAAR
jgi:adenosylcobinamide-GDP ribazoletransferase